MANYKSAYTGAEIDAGIAKANTAIQDVSDKQDKIDSSHKLSADLISNGSTNKVVTQSEKTTWSGKQDALVSGTNIKTINNESILGNGNITISGGDSTDVKINGTSITSEGEANIVTETAYDASTNKIATMSDVPDVTNYVTNTDYATSSTGGVVKVSNGDYGMVMDEGVLKGAVRTVAQYNDMSSKGMVCKGTLENVLTNKGYQEALTAGANIIIDENNVISSEGGSPSIIFAAADSSAINKKKAHYICTGTNDQDLINSVLSQMTKGELLFLEGTYNISAEVDLKSYVNMTGIGNPVFKLTNRSISTLSQAVTAGDTSIFVSDPKNFVLNQKISIGGTGFNYDVAPGCIKSINTDTGEITFYNRGTHAGTGSVGKNNAIGATVYSEPSIFVSCEQTDIKIEGISFDGNRANLAGYTSDTDFGSNCIQIIGGSRIKVLNNIITECYKHGVLVGWATTDTIVMNNIISNCSTHGIDIYINTERILLSGNCMTAANIQCHNGQYVNIENNTLKNCSLIQQGGAQYNTIIGNYIEPAARAIQLTGGVSNILISNNTTKGGEYGIQIDGCTKITLTNNNFLNSKGAGIHLYNTTYSNVSDNTLGDVDSTTSQAAIKLEQTCTRNKISNNFIRGTASKTTYGIQELAATSDDNYINNNICYNCGSGIVEKLGKNTVETGNAAIGTAQ